MPNILSIMQKGDAKMDEYKKPYLTLWNAVTDATKAIEQQNFGLAKELLKKAQQDAEEAYVGNGK